MDVANVLFCTGDPVLDLYSFGSFQDSKFKTSRLVRNHGGALNVWKNAEAILGKGSVVFLNPLKYTLPILLKDTVNLYTVTRYIDENDSSLLLEGSITPSHQKPKFYSNRSRDISVQLNKTISMIPNLNNKGFVISDYNKGAFNRSSKQSISNLPEFDFCLVDTRYRSLKLDLINTSKIKIWHATADEYDEEYAKNYHYVFHSSGPDRVRILTGTGELICQNDKRLLVPNTKVVNTCGAGDTFTAAAASYLLKQDKINDEALVEACSFAIKCCQQVITTRCTTQTTIQLE
jgi:bifunctional ADP-heptose synthase (sugar kinase/adenylyltransferase)